MNPRILFALAALFGSGAFAASQNWHGKDLRRQDLKNENLDRADLSEANLEAADLTNATLKGARLTGANLERARLTTADLSGADLRGANLKQATLEDAKFIKANLSGTNVYLAYGFAAEPDAMKKAVRVLDDARVRVNVLSERNGTITFKEADLRNSRLYGSLDGVDLRGADLRGADLTNVREPDKAKLKGAIYDSTTRWPDGFDYAKAGATSVPLEQAKEKADARNEMPFEAVGTWLIKVEPNGAREEGLLTVAKDRTYVWDYTAKAPPIHGTWQAAATHDSRGPAGSVMLLHGESGEDWILMRDGAHPERPDSALLKQVKGEQTRWLVPVSLSNR